MPKPKPKFHFVAYYLRRAMTTEAFAKFWAHMARPPFEARKYGDVQRMKLPFSQADESRAYRMLDLGVLLVRGKGLAYFVEDSSSIDRLMFELEPSSMGNRSRTQWLSWLVDLFDCLSVVFAFGCLETEFDAKHWVKVQLPDGSFHFDKRGCWARDFKTCLPGVYWLNYYGSEIGEQLGQRIATNENLELTNLTRNRFLALLKEPLAPVDLGARLALERRIAKEIGEDHFFDNESSSSNRHQVPRLAAILESIPG